MIGVILAYLGAEVTKVEDPGVGDGARGWLQTGFGAQTHQVDRNYVFEGCNRGKKSITLGLRTDRGREIFYRLIRQSDIFVHNWRSDSIAVKLKADYATLSTINPRLVYCHSSGWGPTGPISDQASYDTGALARSGFAHLCREPGAPPIVFPGGIGDIMAAITGVNGILAALHARDRIGRGQKVDASLLGSLIQVITPEVCSTGIAHEDYPLRSRSKMGNPLFNHYPCKDGKWLTFCMTQPDRYWHSFCLALGLENIEQDPRFASIAARGQNAVALIQVLDARMAEKTRDEWIGHFTRTRADIMYAPIQTIPEVLADPQVLANDYVVEYDHPSYGPIRTPGVPFKFSASSTPTPTAAPELGQHTEEILLALGYTWEDIGQFRDSGAI
jgi:crotonobetainyl-CoA:carnitine CoA-transferase CaiB-like acyl-CoA transferase